MRYSLLLLFILFFHWYAMGERYVVVYASSDKILIGGKNANTGLAFEDTDEIQWSSSNQALQAKDLQGHRLVGFTAKSFENANKSKSLFEYLSVKTPLSDRRLLTGTILQDTVVYLLKNAYLQTCTPECIDRKYSVKLYYSNDIIIIRHDIIKDSDGYLVIPRDIFGQYNPRPSYIDILETDNQGWTYPIYDHIMIDPIPL